MGRKRRQSRTRGATRAGCRRQGQQAAGVGRSGAFGALAAVLALVGFVGDDPTWLRSGPERRARPGLVGMGAGRRTP